MEIMYIKNINNNYIKTNNIIALIGEYSDLKTLVNNEDKLEIKINQTVSKYLKKDIFILEQFSLNNITNKKIKDLSSTEQKIIKLIKIISLNPKLIILNNFEIGINEKYLNTIVRFLKNVNNEREINIILISNNISFIKKMTNNIIVIKNNIVRYQGNLLPAIKKGLIPKPEIIKFIEDSNKNLIYTLDEKELLKDIYRSIN